MRIPDKTLIHAAQCRVGHLVVRMVHVTLQMDVADSPEKSGQLVHTHTYTSADRALWAVKITRKMVILFLMLTTVSLSVFLVLAATNDGSRLVAMAMLSTGLLGSLMLLVMCVAVVASGYYSTRPDVVETRPPLVVST